MKFTNAKILGVICIFSAVLSVMSPLVALGATNTTSKEQAAQVFNQEMKDSGLTPEQIINNNLDKLPNIKELKFVPVKSEVNKSSSSILLTSLPNYGEGRVLVTASVLASSLGSLGHAAICSSSTYNLSSFAGIGVNYFPNSTWNNYSSMGMIGGSYMQQAASNVVQYVGLGYNYALWNKYITSAFYCSQLVWRGFYNYGVDLSPGSTTCAPKEIWVNTNALPMTYYSYNMQARS